MDEGGEDFVPDPSNPNAALPLTVTTLDSHLGGAGFSGDDPQLVGTGFEANACTNWYTVKGSVRPNADITIGFFIADMGDDLLATLAILDNFRWKCAGCVAQDPHDCGAHPL